ncbi:MAG TPA: chemotaxis protein CheW [Desulfuromonadales bacterium]|nr:chemotaxis protein CheW [Desulfuromonadales bacterium]
MHEQTAAEAIDVTQYLSFRLDENIFAVKVTKAREILDFAPVTRVPQTPDHMLGVINLRGHVVPIVDLRRKFGMPAVEPTRDSCIIVLEVDAFEEKLTIGAVADAVQEVLELPSDRIEPPPRLGNGINTRFIDGMGKTEEHFLILLNVDMIFTSEESDQLHHALPEPEKMEG